MLTYLLCVSLALIVVGVVSGSVGKRPLGGYFGGYEWPASAVWLLAAGLVGVSVWGVVSGLILMLRG